MRVDEGRSEHEPAGRLDGGLDGDDDAVLDRDVEGAVEVAAGSITRAPRIVRLSPGASGQTSGHATSRPRATSIGPPASRS